MTKEIEKEKEKIEGLEVENEMLAIIIRNKIDYDNNAKEKLNELKGSLDKKTRELKMQHHNSFNRRVCNHVSKRGKEKRKLTK